MVQKPSTKKMIYRAHYPEGFHVCEYNASAAAGAVYGIVTFVAKLPVISARDQIIKEIAEDDV